MTVLARASQCDSRVRALAVVPRPLDLARWAERRLSRVEHLLARRRNLAGELTALALAAAAALSEALAIPVSCVARLRSTPTDAPRSPAAPCTLCLLQLDGPGVAALLELEPRFVVGLVAHLAGAPAPAVPVLGLSGFERAVLGHLVLVTLAGLRTQPAAERRWRPRLVGIVPSRLGVEASLGRRRLLGVDLEVRAGDRSCRAGLLIPESAVQTLILGVEEEALPGVGAARAARFSLRPRVRCGVLWPSELQELRAGAALMVPEMGWVDGLLEGPLELSHGAAVLTGQLIDGGWALGTLESSRRMTEVTCVDPQLSSLPVELEVELASVPLTLGELSALRPGSIVPLRISVGEPVFLRTGDRRVARAELVDLDGEVAARVLQLLE